MLIPWCWRASQLVRPVCAELRRVGGLAMPVESLVTSVLQLRIILNQWALGMFTWSQKVGADLMLSAGSAVLQESLEVRAPVFKGLQVIVSLSSRLQGGVDGSTFPIEEAGAYFVLCTGEHDGLDRFEANVLQRHVRISMDADAAERSGLSLDMVAQSGGKHLHNQEVMVIHQPLTSTLRAAAMQILYCPFQAGAVRDLFLGGKSMELAAAALARPLAQRGAKLDQLDARDVQRLWLARDILVGRAHEPPSLPQLAREVGMNVKKLTAGFRQVFGMSVFEYLQQHRLEEAYRMLCSGGMTVTQVAAHVGYAVAHFSTVFKDRFGISPRDLLR